MCQKDAKSYKYVFCFHGICKIIIRFQKAHNLANYVSLSVAGRIWNIILFLIQYFGPNMLLISINQKSFWAQAHHKQAMWVV